MQKQVKDTLEELTAVVQNLGGYPELVKQARGLLETPNDETRGLVRRLLKFADIVYTAESLQVAREARDWLTAQEKEPPCCRESTEYEGSGHALDCTGSPQPPEPPIELDRIE